MSAQVARDYNVQSDVSNHLGVFGNGFQFDKHSALNRQNVGAMLGCR
ncbi:MAG TPA: hypothetical protein VKF81_11610 [Blastocatellia bacterium]|nr:hypothetical protein [Blastocatellia bacterium]